MTDQAEFDFNFWWIGAGVLLILFIWFMYDWYQTRRRTNRHIRGLKKLNNVKEK
jgi:hypothetical protein